MQQQNKNRNTAETMHQRVQVSNRQLQCRKASTDKAC